VATVFVALWVFFKASDHGQFDDLVGPALRVLQDDDSPQQQERIETNLETNPVVHPHSDQQELP
jgi:cbb3-type cytochrome oxidase maturation protein